MCITYGFKYILFSSRTFWGNDPNWKAYFSDGWEKNHLAMYFPSCFIKPLFIIGWATSEGGGFVDHADYRSELSDFRILTIGIMRRISWTTTRKETFPKWIMPTMLTEPLRNGRREIAAVHRGANQSIGAAGWCGFRHGPWSWRKGGEIRLISKQCEL